MAMWTTELEARVHVHEQLRGSWMTALAEAFPEPKPGLALCSGRLAVRLEVEAEKESDAARLAAARFAGALEKASLELLPHLERLESRRRLRRKSGSQPGLGLDEMAVRVARSRSAAKGGSRADVPYLVPED